MTVREMTVDERFCAGKAPLCKLKLTVTLPGGSFSFPVSLVIPRTEKPCPAIVLINFRPAVPDKYLPSEELADRGYAVASFCYRDVTEDNSDFHDGLAGVLGIDRNAPDASGKLILWAWAAMRVLDHLRTLPQIDSRRIAVAGHSRLAKAALLAAGLDTRFFAVLANEPGTLGGALLRGKRYQSQKNSKSLRQVLYISVNFLYASPNLRYLNAVHQDSLRLNQLLQPHHYTSKHV